MSGRMLLSVCIPTFNRPVELRGALDILSKQIGSLSFESQSQIQCIVSDNHSEYDVAALVSEFSERLDIQLKIHDRNIGPTLNFEFCYRSAVGEYVLILSDDDHLVDGAIGDILACLSLNEPDIVFLPFAPQPEAKFGADSTKSLERTRFLSHVGLLPTLISACIIRRELIANVLGSYLDTSLHHYYYFLHAVDNGERFEVLCRQILYCPYEHNARGYDWFSVFGEQFFRIVDEFKACRVERRTLRNIEREMLVDRIIPAFVNRRIHGYTINQNFDDDSVWRIFVTVSKRSKKFVAYWLLFLPAYLLPVGLIGVMKRGYLMQKSIFFNWH